jgi:dTDP-4-dehydrorhamnose 3,5-epimerase
LIFDELSVRGAYLIRPERRADHRGHFARLWCQQELGERGMVNRIAQINTGFSPVAGTMRGLHYQLPPHAEVKIAGCTRGAVFDVVVDLRRASPTYRHWAGARLTPDEGSWLYVPEGCAHGYLTLERDTELVYMTSTAYAPTFARGVRYNDPAFDIKWPAPIRIISDADTNWPDHTPADAIVAPAA